MQLTKNYSRLFVLSFIIQLLISPLALASEPIQFKTDKGIVKLDDLRGQVVYLDFWASWCKPCRKSFPWMNKMQTRYSKQGLKVIAVNLDAERELANRFLKENKTEFTIAYDPEGKLAAEYKLKGMPTSYLFDRKGKVINIHMGFRQRDVQKLEAMIKNTLEN